MTVRHSRSLVVRLAASALALGIACGGEGGGGGGPTTPDTRSLALAAAPASIGAGEESILTALARTASGGPLAGAVVTFGSQLGQLDATSRTTDADGRAIARLRGGGQSGTTTVQALLDGTSIAATVTVRIGIGSRVTLAASPTSIALSGVSQIQALVERLDGQPTPAGTVVELATTLGGLETPQPRTDSFGVARTILLADGRIGTARVSATTAGADAAATVDVAIGQGLQVTLVASPARMSANGSTTITVLISTATGGTPPAGTVVELNTTLGRLDADRLTADGLGVATTTLRGQGIRGTARVTAMVAGAALATLDVPFD